MAISLALTHVVDMFNLITVRILHIYMMRNASEAGIHCSCMGNSPSELLVSLLQYML